MAAAKALPPMRPPPPPPPPKQMLVPQQAIRRPMNQNKRKSRNRPHENSAPSSPLSHHKPGSVSSPESFSNHSYQHPEAVTPLQVKEAQWALGLQPNDPRALSQEFKKLTQTLQVLNKNSNSKPAETISLLHPDLEMAEGKSFNRKVAQNENIDLTDEASNLGQINPQREVFVPPAPTGTLPNSDHASVEVASKSSFTVSDSSAELQDDHGRTKKKRRFPHGSKSSSNMSESSAESEDKKQDTLEKSISETSSSLALNDKSTSASDEFPNKILEKKKKSKSQKALELMRAKLEEAKKLKLAALAAQGNLAGTELPQDSKAALARARLTLRGALKNREKALNLMNNQVMPPISALEVDLVIQNIAKSGPEDLVYFPAECGLNLARKCLPHVSEQPPDDPQSQVLHARKSQLQQDLDALKQRLALRQKKKQPDKVSKEELERRRVEAQAFMDVSYWKHFVSKQQHLLSEVTEQIKENQKVLDQCTAELKDTNQSLESTTTRSADLELRRKAVTAMADEKTYQLVELRNRLYGLQENKKKAENKFESQEQAVKDDIAEPETDDLPSELDAFADTPLDQTTTELEEKVHTLLETPIRDLEKLVDAE
jgi:hypothetical protein